jgi:hypothetical protein
MKTKTLLVLIGVLCVGTIASASAAVQSYEKSTREQWLSTTAMSVALTADRYCTGSTDASCRQRVVTEDAAKVAGLSESQKAAGLSQRELVSVLREQARGDVLAFYM